MEDREGLKSRIRELEQRLAEAEDTLRALREGEVDAVVAQGPEGERIYTLKGADEPYRLMVQQMAEGAITLTSDGLILFSNQQFADTIGVPLERVIGTLFYEFLDADSRDTAAALLVRARMEDVKGEIRLRKPSGVLLPAYVSANRLYLEAMDGFCVVVTDLTEQKRNEETQLAERLARSILEQAAEAILVLDLNGKIIRASGAANRLAGANVLLEDIDKVLEIRSPGGMLIDFEAILAIARRGAGSGPLEMHLHTAANHGLAILFSVAPLSDANGTLLGCIVHVTDITQRKQMEKALRESEEMYRSLADAMPQIVDVRRSDGSREFVNRKWGEYTGGPWSPETTDAAWMSRVHPEDRVRVIEVWSRANQSQEPLEMEYRLRRHDGEYRWHLSRAIPVCEENGSVGKWIGTATDIHESKRTETMLRESEARLSSMAAAVPEILFTTRADGSCDYMSAKAYQFTGLWEGALEGFGWLDVIHPDDRTKVRLEWTRTGGFAGPIELEFRLRRADGTYRWMQMRAVPMLSPGGEIQKWFGISTDIDDHRRLEESLKHQSQELKRSNDELQLFAHAVSHDLQEPLRTIGAMTKLLSEHSAVNLDEKGKELFEYVDNGVTRMSTLIRDLLDYSRVSNEEPATVKPTDCNALLNFALMNLSSQIEKTGASVISDPLPVVLADEQLVRVFQNLIGNALKYRSERAPEIHVSAIRCSSAQNQEWTISVSDNGIGIDMKHADRIFRVFQRLHSRQQYEGTGIGLAICRKIVETYGGRIWLESVEGAGSTFYFSLRGAESR